MPQPQAIRQAIEEMGAQMGVDTLHKCEALFGAEQAALAEGRPPLATDQAYGPHERNRLDVYGSGSGSAPVIIWVHGGGFVRGDKAEAGNPFNAHIGRWAAANGMVGVVINYRLAPEAQWPSGAEDVAAALAWTRANIARYGGDPGRIVLMGTSAGGAHIASYIHHHPDATEARAAVMLSSIFDLEAPRAGNPIYYGEDVSRRASQSSLNAVAGTALPLFIACAEFDPPGFQQQTLGLLQKRIAAQGTMPNAYIAQGHSHYSMPMHIGTADDRLSGEILDFIGRNAG